MKPEWDLPTQFEALGEIANRQISRVLLEYDGPQLVVLADRDREYLAVAVDEDESATRWLQVPISHLELRALVIGARSVREALRKPTVTVVDYAHDLSQPAFAWLVQWSEIPDRVLPRPGVRLPIAVPGLETET